MSSTEAFTLVFIMGAVILLCRIFPFVFLRKTSSSSLGTFVEKTVPPAAMTVLVFNALASSFSNNGSIDGILTLTAAAITAIVHIWKRNTLISILGGTAVYMILSRVLL